MTAGNHINQAVNNSGRHDNHANLERGVGVYRVGGRGELDITFTLTIFVPRVLETGERVVVV